MSEVLRLRFLPDLHTSSILSLTGHYNFSFFYLSISIGNLMFGQGYSHFYVTLPFFKLIFCRVYRPVEFLLKSVCLLLFQWTISSRSNTSLPRGEHRTTRVKTPILVESIHIRNTHVLPPKSFYY